MRWLGFGAFFCLSEEVVAEVNLEPGGTGDASLLLRLASRNPSFHPLIYFYFLLSTTFPQGCSSEVLLGSGETRCPMKRGTEVKPCVSGRQVGFLPGLEIWVGGKGTLTVHPVG